MVASPRANASEVQADASLKKVLGMSGLTLDKLPLFVNSGLVNIFGGASGNLINFLIPFDWKAIAAYKKVTVVPGTGAATVGIGTSADTDGILDDYSIATNEALTFLDLSANAAFTAAAAVVAGGGSQGDLMVFQTDGGGTTTGKAVWGVTIVPN